MLVHELLSKTDALTSVQGEMANMMQALAASMRSLEERFNRHIAASENDEDDEDEDAETRRTRRTKRKRSPRSSEKGRAGLTQRARAVAPSSHSVL